MSNEPVVSVEDFLDGFVYQLGAKGVAAAIEENAETDQDEDGESIASGHT